MHFHVVWLQVLGAHALASKSQPAWRCTLCVSHCLNTLAHCAHQLQVKLTMVRHPTTTISRWREKGKQYMRQFNVDNCMRPQLVWEECVQVPPPPLCNGYALVIATVGVGTVLIWYLILIRYKCSAAA